MNDKYQETFNTWNKIAELYEDKFMDLDLYNDTYDRFSESLATNVASVLEVGCGPGNITRYLLDRNPDLKIVGIDISENMIRLAKRNNPEADFQVMDCREINTIANQFEGIIVGFTLPYLSAADSSRFLADCNKSLKPKGVLYLSFVKGAYENSGYISGSTGDRTYFYYHEPEQIAIELEKNGLKVTYLIEKAYQKSDGTLETHVIIIANKSKG